MVAGTARATVRREESASRKPVRRVKRRRRMRMRGFVNLALCVTGLVGFFGWAGVHGHLATTGYSRSRLVAECRQERIKNERLKVEFIRKSSPRNVMCAADKAGMVYASRYDYLSKSQTVASARGAR